MTKPQLNQEKILGHAQYFEYTTSADPLGSGLISSIPYQTFSHALHEEGETRIIPLDVSKGLGVPYPATSPGLLANFVRILHNEHIRTCANATSHLFYVIRGNGHTEVDGLLIPWNTGDFFALPAHQNAIHYADTDSAFYYIHDEPLLNYLGAKTEKQCFEPTLYLVEESYANLQKAIDSKTKNRNRLSILLANKALPQTRTITHVLWAMFGVLPVGAVQPPHRHQSVALDLAVDCQPGCYTLIGKSLNPDGSIKDPTRVDWAPHSAFITPPGYWHSHHNESGVQAHVIPIQDVGLHTYLRTLDIQFGHLSSYSNFIG
jgi:gentisate 1,2-dioxygenase